MVRKEEISGKDKEKKDTYMKGLGRAVLGADLGFFNGGQVGAADRQQSPTAGKRNRKSSSKHDGYRSHTITQSYSLAQHLALKSEEISVYQAFSSQREVKQSRGNISYNHFWR